ncbi:MAG: sugar ABC transporter permease [Eubacteriales bacterium]|nr:sugar ABC transporter permease [Eubacteriales bacterium]
MEQLKSTLKKNIQQYTMIIALIVIWLVFTIATEGIFLTPRNITNLFLQMAYVGIASSTMVLIMVCGHIDLSTGSVIGFSGALIAYFLKFTNINIWVAIIIVLACGALIGVWQGFWVAKFGLPAFIVTLSSEWVFRGLIIRVTNSTTIQPNNPTFKAIGQGYLPNILGEDANVNLTALLIGAICIVLFIASQLSNRRKKQRYDFKVESTGMFVARVALISIVIAVFFYVFNLDRGVAIPLVILAVIVFTINFISKKTAFGRHVYAIGGNREAAALSGVNVQKVTWFVFILMGTMSAASGIVYTARLNSAAIAAGTGAETDIIAAAIIGGTSPAGGKGSVVGCVIGALVMASLENGMSILSMGSFEKYLAKGLVLLFAVAIDFLTKDSQH